MRYHINTLVKADLPAEGAWSTRTSTGCGNWFTSCKADRTVTSLRAEPSNDTSNTSHASAPVF